MLVDWQVIVYNDTTRDAVQPEFDHVLASRIVNWVTVSILWMQNGRDQSLAKAPLKCSANAKAGNEGAISHILLLDRVRCDCFDNTWFSKRWLYNGTEHSILLSKSQNVARSSPAMEPVFLLGGQGKESGRVGKL